MGSKRRSAALFAWVVALTVAMLGGAVQPASADDELLVASDPYAHQVLDSPPGGVQLAFSRAVDAAAAQIVVTNSDGNSVNINSLIVEGTNVTAQVKPNLPKGTYTVHYQVNRKDGQVEGGAFQFSYGPGQWTTLSDAHWSGNSAQPSVLASPTVDTSTTLPSSSATETDTLTTDSPTDATATPGASSSSGDAGLNPWLWGGGALVAVAIGAAVWLVAVKRRNDSGGDA